MYSALLTYFAAGAPAADCKTSGLLGFPYWYEYIAKPPACQPAFTSLSDVWLIGAALLEILLRVAAIAAVVYIIYGGVTYVTSQGEPDKTQKAKMTIINALGGLVVAVSATAIVAFIAGRIN